MRTVASHAITAIALTGMLGLVQGCESQASSLCSLICECEHCNDYAQDMLCIEIETDFEVADVYGCATEWEAYATCYEEKGECDEKAADFSTRPPGHCGGQAPYGYPCATQADCDSIAYGLTCTNGECMERVCIGDPYPCASDSDCPGGVSRCQNEWDDFDACVTKSSGHGTVQPP